MVARATAPNKVGPESVFPDAAKWDFSDGLKGSPMASAPFWIAMICQIVIVIGYFWFYRKEQLGMFLHSRLRVYFTDSLVFSAPIITTQMCRNGISVRFTMDYRLSFGVLFTDWERTVTTKDFCIHDCRILHHHTHFSFLPYLTCHVP